MESVGEKLKKARLEKNLSLDEVYKQTKIHPRVLEALEQDRAHNFLGFLYVKGFLRNYALFLGLDVEKLLKEYIDSQKIEQPSEQVRLGKESKVSVKFNPFLVLRIAAILVVSLTLILYFRFLIKRISWKPQKAKEQKVKVRVMPASKVLTEELALEVKTKDACWMRVTADGQTIFEKTLPKGRHERWQAKEKIELRIGKPEVLEVFLNGKPIDLKKVKVKRSLVITHQGIVGK